MNSEYFCLLSARYVCSATKCIGAALIFASATAYAEDNRVERCLQLTPVEATACLNRMDFHQQCKFGSIKDRAACIKLSNSKAPPWKDAPEQTTVEGDRTSVLKPGFSVKLVGYTVTSTISYRGDCIAALTWSSISKGVTLLNLSRGYLKGFEREDKFMCNKGAECIARGSKISDQYERIGIDWGNWKEKEKSDRGYKLLQRTIESCMNQKSNAEDWAREQNYLLGGFR